MKEFDRKFDFEIEMCGFNKSTLMRLFLGHVIPNTVKKLLYLDCDVIINDSLSDLWNTDITQYYLAGVPEFFMPKEKRLELGLEEGDIYYNAGVLLWNMEEWRIENLETKFLDFYKGKQGKLQYLDQDIINYCCKGRFKTLNVTYNFPPSLYYYPIDYARKLQPLYKDSSREEYKQVIALPCMIHFMGEERPWIKGNKNPYRMYYEHYKIRSPWKEMKPVEGQVLYMKCYYILNLITKIFPSFRMQFTKIVGINKFKWFGKL